MTSRRIVSGALVLLAVVGGCGPSDEPGAARGDTAASVTIVSIASEQTALVTLPAASIAPASDSVPAPTSPPIAVSDPCAIAAQLTHFDVELVAAQDGSLSERDPLSVRVRSLLGNLRINAWGSDLYSGVDLPTRVLERAELDEYGRFTPEEQVAAQQLNIRDRNFCNVELSPDGFLLAPSD